MSRIKRPAPKGFKPIQIKRQIRAKAAEMKHMMIDDLPVNRVHKEGCRVDQFGMICAFCKQTVLVEIFREKHKIRFTGFDPMTEECDPSRVIKAQKKEEEAQKDLGRILKEAGVEDGAITDEVQGIIDEEMQKVIEGEMESSGK